MSSVDFLNELKLIINLESYYKFRNNIKSLMFLAESNKELYDDYITNLECLEYNIAFNDSVKSSCIDLINNAKDILLLDKSLSENEKIEISNFTYTN